MFLDLVGIGVIEIERALDIDIIYRKIDLGYHLFDHLAVLFASEDNDLLGLGNTLDNHIRLKVITGHILKGRFDYIQYGFHVQIFDLDHCLLGLDRFVPVKPLDPVGDLLHVRNRCSGDYPVLFGNRYQPDLDIRLTDNNR